MTLVEINLDPTRRQLRQFGVIALVALPLIGWLWGASLTVIGVLAAMGLILAVIAMLFPRAIRPVFLLLTILAIPIGLVISELILVLIYFGLFTPIGLVFRLMKRDALQLRRNPLNSTYWQSKSPPRDVSSYYHQF